VNFIKKWFQNNDIATWRTAVSAVRRDYTGSPLTEAVAGDNPLALFEKWFAEAVELSKYDPNAMVLSTVRDGQPSGRVVLLKGFDERGFVFFTNYESNKAEAIAENPNVSLTFHWPEVFRQLRIEGVTEKISISESDAYFQSRPKESNYSALSSPQSKIVSGREELERRLAVVKEQWKNKTSLIRPENWGGYRVKPTRYEFWQGRVNRLHDRIVFIKDKDSWQKVRLGA